MADILSKLVLDGKKKATASLHKIYELDNEKIPEKDEIAIVLNGSNEPVAAIKNTEVKIVPFTEITEEDARTEGEGDLSLGYWRNAHIEFFTRECEKYGIKFSKNMLIVFEKFELIYKKQLT